MIIKGTVQGKAATKRPEFTYRKPIMRRLENVWDVDPERLNYCDEYPRSINSPKYSATTKSVDLADYTVTVTPDPDGSGRNIFEVWMQPNEYTPAKNPRLVHKAHCSLSLLTLDEVNYLLATLVFATQ